MATTYVLYDLATGRNCSESKEPINNPDTKKYGIKTTELYGIWNTDLSVLDFEPRPVDKHMSTLSFMELFTDAELIIILDTAKVSTQVELFVLKMKQASFIDLNYQPTIDGIKGLVAADLITEARSWEILNG